MGLALLPSSGRALRRRPVEALVQELSLNDVTVPVAVQFAPSLSNVSVISISVHGVYRLAV